MSFRASKRSLPRTRSGTRPAASASSAITTVHVDHDGHRQVVAPADLEVVRVVRGRDLHDAGAERGIGVLVRHYRNVDVHDRQADALADECLVTVVVRAHRDGDVAQHGFRAGCCDDQGGAEVRGVAPRRHTDPVGHRVPDLIQRTRLLLEFRLLVAQRREAARAPVDHPVAAVDQAVVIQADEGFPHGHAQLRRERVRRATPVG